MSGTSDKIPLHAASRASTPSSELQQHHDTPASYGGVDKREHHRLNLTPPSPSVHDDDVATPDSSVNIIKGRISPASPYRQHHNDANEHTLLASRLSKRKKLIRSRCLIGDTCLLFAMIGLMLMIFETEAVIHAVYTKVSVASHVVKAFISASTLVLLVLITAYNWLELRMFMVDNSLDSWKLAISLSTVLKWLLELLVCGIHPPPGDFDYTWITFSNQKSLNTKMTVDVLLSLPMFLRFYLIGRVIMLHSSLYQDTAAQSLSAINRTHFDFRFIMKSLMHLYPEYVIVGLTSWIFVWASWMMRACEMSAAGGTGGPDVLIHNIFDSMWLVSITFLSVGYGDKFPVTTCGKTIAVLTGILGAGCIALVVAILSKNLELDRMERKVHNYVTQMELTKKMKHAAANVVKEGWLSHKYRAAVTRRGKHRKLAATDSGGSDDQRDASDLSEQKALKHERRLLQAIHRIRDIKEDQKRVEDNDACLIDMCHMQTDLKRSIQHLQTQIDDIQSMLRTALTVDPKQQRKSKVPDDTNSEKKHLN